MASVEWKPALSRESLLEAIMESLHSWPEVHRRIFIDIHYGGKSIAEVAGNMGIPQEEILDLLDRCARNLRHALQAWRGAPQDGISLRPTHSPAYVPRSCCR